MAGIATTWTALQLVPLGVSLAGKTSDGRGLVLSALTRALGHLPSSATAITLDPGATRLEVLKGCALLCTFVACHLTARRGHERFLLVAISTSGALMSVVALTHRALNAQSLFGVYQWRQATPRLPAPILNDNCLAGFLVLTATVTVGLAVTSTDHRARVLHYLAAFTMVGTGFLTGSRAGTGAMIFALMALLFGDLLRSGKQRVGRRTPMVLLGVLMAGTVAIAAVVGAEPLLATLGSDDFSKLDLIRAGVSLAWRHPWVGVGRGAFSAAMTSEMSDRGRFVHAENFIVTWLSEWGLAIGLLVLAGASLAVLRLLRETSTLRFSAGIALLAFGAQNLFDLGVELLGIATVAASILGACVGGMDADKPASPHRGYSALERVAIVLGVATFAVLIWVSPSAWSAGDHTFDQRLDLRDRSGPEAFRAELQQALLAHPFEPILYFTAARDRVDHGDPAGLRWLNLAMLRAPRWSAPHAEASRLLNAMGHHHQAALEARETALRNPGLGARAACSIAHNEPDHIDYLIVASEGARERGQEQVFFDVLTQCLERAPLRALDRHLIAHRPAIRGPVLREHARLLADGQESAALSWLESATKGATPDPAVVLALARLLKEANRLSEAGAQLRRATGLGVDPEAALRLSAEIAAARGDVAGMRVEIEALRARGAGSGSKLANAAVLLARLEADLGNFAESDAAADGAVALDPSVGTLRAALNLARRRSNPAKAARIRASLCEIAPDSPECRSARP